jgi:hypothetical protein
MSGGVAQGAAGPAGVQPAGVGNAQHNRPENRVATSVCRHCPLLIDMRHRQEGSYGYVTISIIETRRWTASRYAKRAACRLSMEAPGGGK